MRKGWIKIYRQLSVHPIAQDPFMLSIFMHLLMSATFKDSDDKGLGVGQTDITQMQLALVAGMSRKKVRNILGRLETELGAIKREKKGHRKYVITLVNWDTYQTSESKQGRKRATKGATLKEDKKVKNKSIAEPCLEDTASSETSKPKNVRKTHWADQWIEVYQELFKDKVPNDRDSAKFLNVLAGRYTQLVVSNMLLDFKFRGVLKDNANGYLIAALTNETAKSLKASPKSFELAGDGAEKYGDK